MLHTLLNVLLISVETVSSCYVHNFYHGALYPFTVSKDRVCLSLQNTEMRHATPLSEVYVCFQSGLWKTQSRQSCLWSLQSSPQWKSSLVTHSEKHSEIVFQVLYGKLACFSASSYPPLLSLVTAVKMISLCSIISRWRSWTINWMFLSSGAFTKCNVWPTDGPEDGAWSIPFCRMVYDWNTNVMVYLTVFTIPVWHAAVEQKRHRKYRVWSS